MNITNLEITQATIEIFGGLVCLMLLTIMIMNGYKKKSWTRLKAMLSLTALILFSEACAYIFRGNTDGFSVFMTRSCNLCVFLLNVVLGYFAVQYVYALLQEKEIVPNKIYIRIAGLCVLANAIILVLNLFTGWMYYFDGSNYYHRNTLWYLYTILNLVCILMAGIVGIKYRKNISVITLCSILFYLFVPIICIIAQIFIYGISIANIGVFTALLLMLGAYLKGWSKTKENGGKQRKIVESVVLFTIMTISMSASIISCIVSIERISNEKAESDGKLVANMVSAGIENEFLKPIVVADTMSKDYNLKELMKKSGEESPESVEKEMSAYLESIRSGFNYQMVYAVSEASKAYYTYDGICKYVDTENDAHDIWYKDFLESGKHYELEVDTDEANQWALSVFVNAEIADQNGDLLGVCGIGIEMSELQNLLRQYEDTYHVKIDLIDAEGLIQIDTEEKTIEQEYLDNSYLRDVNSDTFYYRKGSGKSKLTKYMESLDWYLVVEYQNQGTISAIQISFTSIVIFVIGLIMMGIVFSVFFIRERNALKELMEKKKISITDDLTGLFNRRAFEEDCGKISENDIGKMIIVMMDVNGLKKVNDTYGHAVGDELLIGAGNCIRNSLGKYGKIYRTGGDEFVALLECTRSQLDDVIATFEHVTANWQLTHPYELSISKGVVVCKEHPELNLYEMKKLADELMYKDKNEYYLRTGKERRRF